MASNYKPRDEKSVEDQIKEYIKNQLEEDYMADQISLKEYTDPFTGSRGE